MRFLNILIATALALFLNTSAQANIHKQKIHCPSIDTIHQIAPLLQKGKMSGRYGEDVSYDVSTETSLENGLNWHILSANIVANSAKEAAVIAQNRCINVSHTAYEFARTFSRHDNPVCLYYDRSLTNPVAYIMAELRSQG